MHLREHAATGRGGLLEQGEVDAPGLGVVPPAEQAPRHGHAGLHGEVAQPDVVLAQALRLAAEPLAGELEDAGVHVAHHGDQPPDLVPGGEPARHRAPVGRLVARRARRREADGAGADGVSQFALHRPQILLAGRLLERPLAHGVGAEGGVADVAGVVDPLGQGLHAIEELGEGGPRPVDAGVHRLGGDVLGPF